MTKHAPVAFVAALLAGTAIAFVYTESLKLTPSPILGTKVTKIFSPVCRCKTSTATIAFRLRSADRLEIDIVRGSSTVVRRLIQGRLYRRGAVAVRWNGRDDGGRVVPAGSYKPRVRLMRQRRTIVLPNPIRVDVTSPIVTFVSLAPRIVSPQPDHRAERAVVHYRVNEPARVVLLVDGRLAVRKRGTRQVGEIDWFGTVGGAPVSQGRHRLQLVAQDVAGNVGRRSEPKEILVRYIDVIPRVIEVRPGGIVTAHVLSSAARFSWKLGARSGSARPGLLKVRAPRQAGRFTLTVIANGHRARAAVLVRRSATP